MYSHYFSLHIFIFFSCRNLCLSVMTFIFCNLCPSVFLIENLSKHVNFDSLLCTYKYKLPCNILHNESQRDVLFLKFFFIKYSICFGHVHCPSGVSQHCIHAIGICHANRTSMKNTYCVYTVLRYSWWWTVDMSETCRVLYGKKTWEMVHLVGFHYKNISRCTFLWMSNLPCKTSMKYSIDRHENRVRTQQRDISTLGP
jgi:hypothetical protein